MAGDETPVGVVIVVVVEGEAPLRSQGLGGDAMLWEIGEMSNSQPGGVRG